MHLQQKIQEDYRGSLDGDISLGDLLHLAELLISQFGPAARMAIKVQHDGTDFQLQIEVGHEAIPDDEASAGVRPMVSSVGEREDCEDPQDTHPD